MKEIAAAFGAEYTKVLDRKYLGFAGQTIHSMIAHLRTWFTITDADQDDANKNFCAPWSDFPNTHISTYARRLTRLQNEDVDIQLDIPDATKLRVLVRSARSSELFTRKFLDAYEDAGDQKTWDVQLPRFEAEYTKIMRAAGRAGLDAEYESAAALREQRRRADAQRLPPQAAKVVTAPIAGDRYTAAM